MTDSYKHAVLVIYAAFSNLGGSVDLISLGSYHISALHAAVQIQYLLYHCILSSSVVSLFWIHLFSLHPQCAFTLNVHIFFSSLGLPHNFRFLHINYIFFPVNSCGGLQLPFSLGFYSPLSDVLAKSAVFPFWRLIQCLALWVVSALISTDAICHVEYPLCFLFQHIPLSICGYLCLGVSVASDNELCLLIKALCTCGMRSPKRIGPSAIHSFLCTQYFYF